MEITAFGRQWTTQTCLSAVVCNWSEHRILCVEGFKEKLGWLAFCLIFVPHKKEFPQGYPNPHHKVTLVLQ